jgi:hypothetical protein
MINPYSHPADLIGIAAWQNENVIHLEIGINTLILVAVILLITVGIFIFHFIMEFCGKYFTVKASNHY